MGMEREIVTLMKARIYEIKSSAAANAEVLRDEENDRFFWNDLKFLDFEVGDRIFFVNKPGGWVLYTTIGEKDIATDQANGKATFSYDGHSYSVDDPGGRFGKFVRFDVLQESPIGADDEWTGLGSSEVNDLWRDGEEVDTTTTRMERIQQLKRIFRDGEGAKALAEIETMLGGAEPLVAQGVVVVDSGTWFEGAMAELQQAGHIVLWWSKRPVGVEVTMTELRNRLDNVGHFDLYYTVDRKARYRARVKDFATESDYSATAWSEGRTVAGLQERYEDYKGESPSGKMQNARIAFLVDRMERLEPEIPILRFRFKNGPDGLTQDNMLPYTRLMKEPEWSAGPEPVTTHSAQDQAIREEFKKYLNEVVGASPNTVDQYLGSMPYLQRWFIEVGAAIAGFNIWRDHASVASIQSILDGAASAAWTELNKKQNNSRRAPWNHWRRFLEQRNDNAMRFTDEHRAILCAIKTKPFILLAGISGTGKSRMVRTLAYQTCSVTELRGDRPGNYALIMVKPNWHDPTELIGYVSRIDGQPKYVVTEFLRFLVKAWRYPQVPFFLCLDEMNLAPVEQYFADFLSVVETRRVKDGKVISDAILSKANMDDPSVFEVALAKLGLDEVPALKEQFMRDGITLPPNLVVMGTVNMDETTHSFSRKVLDRAMTFEMNQVDLRGGLDAEDKKWSYADPAIAANLVLGDLTRGGEVPASFAQREDVLKWLEQLNGILEGTPFKVAYRVRDEFLIYAYHNSLLSAKPANWLDLCLDELLVMKVLSRIEGDENRVGEVLTKLTGLVPATWVHSTKKLNEMQRKLTFGYTSFWS